MRFSSVSFTTVILAVLWLGEFAHANIELDIPGVIVEDSSTNRPGQAQTALVKYQGNPAFLKCHTDKEAYKIEHDALVRIHRGDPRRYGMPSKVKNMFVALKGSVQTRKGTHCLVMERLEGDNLTEYVKKVDPKKKDAILSSISVQLITALKYIHRLGWVHGDIKPDNIIVHDDAQTGEPRVTIIDFDASQQVGNDLKHRIGGTQGYESPEEFSPNPLDQYKRDSWMLGATIYSAAVGLPPYGISHSSRTGKDELWNRGYLKNAMAHVARTGEHLFPRIKTLENSSLLKLINMLLEPKVESRPAIRKLDTQLINDLAGGNTNGTPLTRAGNKFLSMMSF
ncbi:kinase-like domain-containing protein [Thamnocephalis sphaerospora]|uniref:Kinase-like domain-containing protein n=1 Tax=Thamnocephalis sphaerospora TaxID=78915 RepID=A0A4P9XL83_9FUNG|nr:kinase-like domain-containing protein [Thamnocephalis sphaerospora]|eukprot:RKP06607.1 kinase-like domain-containing protein [Thamnocephalis sphaerospora]